MWTDEEEAAFAKLMATGLERMEAIRMYRRFKGDLKRALKYAKERSEVSTAGRFKGRLQRSESSQGT
jgi:hypothetical protein